MTLLQRTPPLSPAHYRHQFRPPSTCYLNWSGETRRLVKTVDLSVIVFPSSEMKTTPQFHNLTEAHCETIRSWYAHRMVLRLHSVLHSLLLHNNYSSSSYLLTLRYFSLYWGRRHPSFFPRSSGFPPFEAVANFCSLVLAIRKFVMNFQKKLFSLKEGE